MACSVVYRETRSTVSNFVTKSVATKKKLERKNRGERGEREREREKGERGERERGERGESTFIRDATPQLVGEIEDALFDP